ncbi:hypothetical protein [Aquimarina aquimarini]|uniref:hypothetical protein n=1 Tax=Aquimarina aquimarini TaxID=1191734 RepID=UPI000D5617D1|nr:hypothetical protein [Aquimarina aquimarini]
MSLQEGVDSNLEAQYIQWNIDTKNKEAENSVTNISFEKQKADVIAYKANYWLQKFGNSDRM